jgi:hypothetical protein
LVRDHTLPDARWGPLMRRELAQRVVEQRRPSLTGGGARLWLIGPTAAVVLFLSTGAPLAAVDHEQFCKAMTEIARLGNLDAGRWLDRHTRDDGVEVLCGMRTVNFKRFTNINPDPGGIWRQQKALEWNSTACSSAVLRDAIASGWIITSLVTATSGERTLVIATCK